MSNWGFYTKLRKSKCQTESAWKLLWNYSCKKSLKFFTCNDLSQSLNSLKSNSSYQDGTVVSWGNVTWFLEVNTQKYIT